MNIKGRSLELYFIDGRPDGMLTAEVFNWTGHVLRVPRTQLRDALDRREACYTGVYVLLGEKDGSPLAYIGESEDLGARLRGHAASKDWWDVAILVTSAANNLHKAHVKYLESRLVEIAKETGAIDLENGNTPPRSSLSESSISNMESFLETLQIVLPAIRVDMFLIKKRSLGVEATPKKMMAVKFVLHARKHGITANAELIDGEIVVKAGSEARVSWQGSTDQKTHYFKLFDDLLKSSVLVNSGKNCVFSTDYAFSSPSAAASIITGRSANGRKEWKHSSDGRSYADWEADELSKGDIK